LYLQKLPGEEYIPPRGTLVENYISYNKDKLVLYELHSVENTWEVNK
jgi:hypothetical protein